MSMFGEVIAARRKALGLSQRQLAARIKKEDGTPISPQYLNDLEWGRRHAPSEPLLRQFAEVLGLSVDYLYYLAGTYPSDVRAQQVPPERVEAAFRAFRRELRRGGE